MTKNYYLKNKTGGTKIFLKKRKTKGANMLVSDIEISLKKKKKRRINIFVDDT